MKITIGVGDRYKALTGEVFCITKITPEEFEAALVQSPKGEDITAEGFVMSGRVEDFIGFLHATGTVKI